MRIATESTCFPGTIMSLTIPISIEDKPSELVVELRSLVDGRLIAPIYHDNCQPGIHTIEFDPRSVPGGLEAGIYGLRVAIDGEAKVYPIQYMP
jgi:hypothetical protein